MNEVATVLDVTRHVHLGRCPVCGCAGARPFRNASGLRLVQCPDCTLVYSDPQPRTAVRSRYVGSYDLAAHFEPLRHRKRVLFERRLELIPPPHEDWNRLCDVGCADGQFLALARERGWTCSGVELNPPAAARARSLGLEVFEGDLETMDGPLWGTYDLVTCWDCLEHTPEPRKFAERLIRLAKPGGTIFLTTLNVRSLAFRVFGTRWSMIHEDHFTYWSARSLARLFGELGWSVSDCWTFGLGRDFVSWVDAIQRLGRTWPRFFLSSRASPAAADAHISATWDVRRGVLAAEGALNRALGATGSGVDIACTVQVGRRSDIPRSIQPNGVGIDP